MQDSGLTKLLNIVCVIFRIQMVFRYIWAKLFACILFQIPVRCPAVGFAVVALDYDIVEG